jgi:hypothetical protein
MEPRHANALIMKGAYSIIWIGNAASKRGHNMLDEGEECSPILIPYHPCWMFFANATWIYGSSKV